MVVIRPSCKNRFSFFKYILPEITASRMESYSEEGNIQITGGVYEIVKQEFECKARGTIMVKGKGTMTTYFLMGVKSKIPE